MNSKGYDADPIHMYILVVMWLCRGAEGRHLRNLAAHKSTAIGFESMTRTGYYSSWLDEYLLLTARQLCLSLFLLPALSAQPWPLQSCPVLMMLPAFFTLPLWETHDHYDNDSTQNLQAQKTSFKPFARFSDSLETRWYLRSGPPPYHRRYSTYS